MIYEHIIFKDTFIIIIIMAKMSTVSHNSLKIAQLYTLHALYL